MLPSIILFLALVSSAFTIIKLCHALLSIFVDKYEADFTHFFITSVISAILFSYLFYLIY